MKKQISEEEKNCIFCKIIRKEIKCNLLFEDKKYFIMLDANPITPGHTLVIPKKHTDYIFDLKNKEYKDLMLKSKEIAKKLKDKLNCKRVGVIIEGFGVPHVHVHLVPINHGGELGLKAKHESPEELNKIAEKITK
jgi:histidine triad (HIT) family protein